MRYFKANNYLFLCSFLLVFSHFNTSCEKVLNLKNKEVKPVNIFNDVWELIDKRYALFEVKQLNWDSTYALYRRRINDDMNEKELFAATVDMLETLKDGHVRLLAPFDSGSYQGYFKLYPRNFNFPLLKQRYLRNDYFSFGPLLFKVVDSVGYVYYGSFNEDISDNALDSIFKVISKTKGLILDVRNNAGGNSKNSEKLFRQFIAKRQLIKYEKGKKGSGRQDYLDPEPFYLDPGYQYYNKKICVLTNRTCFSATNDFVLYMSGLSNVTLIGDQTGGGGGIPYDVQLSNGWKLRYTATITLSPQKQPIETGIRPNIPLQITSMDEASGRDPIIEKAFEILK
jgi:hypothetical protein